MKKIFSGIMFSFAFLLLAACGENLNFKEGSAQKAIEGFLKAVNEGDQNKAMKFVLGSLQDAKDIQSFVSAKIKNYEAITEIYSLNESTNFKEKLEEQKKEFNLEKIKANLEKIQPEMGRLAKEKAYLTKIVQNSEEKYYLIYFFSAQNLNNITGIAQIKGDFIDQLDKGSIGMSFQEQLFSKAIENL